MKFFFSFSSIFNNRSDADEADPASAVPRAAATPFRRIVAVQVESGAGQKRHEGTGVERAHVAGRVRLRGVARRGVATLEAPPTTRECRFNWAKAISVFYYPFLFFSRE